MSASRLSVVLIALTLVAAVLGGWVGVSYRLRQAHATPQLDQLLHSGLHLTSDQDNRLMALESEFAAKRLRFETEMRDANRDIATAITVRHQYDADAQAAIDRLNRAMIGLQQATVQHVISMRAVLSRDQVDQFDRTVNQALTATQS